MIKKPKQIQIHIPIYDDMKYSLNRIWAGGAGTQWTRKAKRDLWHSIIEQLVEDEGLKPINYPVDISFEFGWRTKTLDCSNCSVMVKLIEDGLVCAGIFKNDTPEFIRHLHIKSLFLDKKAKSKLEDDYVLVTITPTNEEIHTEGN